MRRRGPPRQRVSAFQERTTPPAGYRLELRRMNGDVLADCKSFETALSTAEAMAGCKLVQEPIGSGVTLLDTDGRKCFFVGPRIKLRRSAA